MPFDKEEYRKRRKEGLRGQGDPLKPDNTISPVVTPSTKPVSKKAIRKNTKRARKANKNGI
jgi:hypothetical protein